MGLKVFHSVKDKISKHVPVLNNKTSKKSEHSATIANTPLTLSSSKFSTIEKPLPEQLNFFQLSQDLNQALHKYATKEKKHQDRLQGYFPTITFDFSINQPQWISFKDTAAISVVLNTLLSDVNNEFSSLYQLVKEIIKKYNLGKIQKNDSDKKRFTFNLNKSLALSLKNTNSTNINFIPAVEDKAAIVKDALFQMDEQKESLLAHSQPKTTADDSNNPFGEEDGSDTQSITSKNSALNSFIAEDNIEVEFFNKKPQESDAGLETPPPPYQQSTANLSAIPAAEPASPQDNNETEISISSSKVNNTKKGELPSSKVIYITEENLQYYASYIRKVGSKNGKNVYIDFTKFPDKEIHSLTALYKKIKNTLNGNQKNNEEIKALDKYLKDSGLNKIINLNKEKHGHEVFKKWHVNFDPSFRMETMSAPPIEEDEKFFNARKAIIDELNQYILEDPKKHLNKLKRTFKYTEAGTYLTITNNQIIWIDEKTWPRSSNDFNHLINYFLENHGGSDARKNTKSHLIQKLRAIYEKLPNTTLGETILREKVQASEASLKKTQKDINEVQLLKNIISSITRDQHDQKNVEYNINRLFDFHLNKKLKKQEQEQVKQANDHNLSTNTNRRVFDKLISLVTHPINYITNSSADRVETFSVKINNLVSSHHTALTENNNIIDNFLDERLAEIINVITENLNKNFPTYTGSLTHERIEFNLKQACTKQKISLSSRYVINTEEELYTKIHEAISTLNLEQTDKSAKALEDWFKTFSNSLASYRDLQEHFKDTVEKKGADKKTLEIIDSHFHKNYTKAKESLSSKLIASIKAMDFPQTLEEKIDQISKSNTLSYANKAEKIKEAMLNYKRNLNSAISLVSEFNEAGTNTLKNAQFTKVEGILNDMLAQCPTPVSRLGVLKQTLFGQGKRASLKDLFFNGVGVVRTAVLGLATLAGGTALTVGVLSAVGIGILTPFLTPLILPAATAALIIGGAIALIGVVGYSVYRTGGRFVKVQQENQLVRKARKVVEREVEIMRKTLQSALVQGNTSGPISAQT